MLGTSNNNSPWMARQLAFTCLCAILFLYFLYSQAQDRMIHLQEQKIAKEFGVNVSEMNYKSKEFLPHGEKEPFPEELPLKLQEEMPNIPIMLYQERYLHLLANDIKSNVSSCRIIWPHSEQLEYHNDHWQTFRQSNHIYRLFGAYHDRRSSIIRNYPMGVVRILAMINQTTGPFAQRFCQFWYPKGIHRVVTVAVLDTILLWEPEWLQYYTSMDENILLFPYMLTCVVPPMGGNGLFPAAVSLTASECATTTNSLKIHNAWPLPDTKAPKKSKKGFAVCVKGLDYTTEDFSIRLVEWLEMQRLLGAEKIIIYDYWHHSNMSKVLDYYRYNSSNHQSKEFNVEVRLFSLATAQPHLPKFEHFMLHAHLEVGILHEMLIFQDCFYRHLYDYRYIATIDLDEILMPLTEDTITWNDLEQRVQRILHNKCPKGPSAICFRNVFFSSKKNQYQYENVLEDNTTNTNFYMLQHREREQNHTALMVRTKCLQNTELVAYVHNHFPFRVLPNAKWCDYMILPTNEAQLQHYRSSLVDDGQHSDGSDDHILVVDNSIQRYAKQLAENTLRILTDLRLI